MKKNLIFNDERRFCRGPDNVWARVGRGAWKQAATITHQKFLLGVMVFGAIRVGFKSQIIRYSKGVGSAEYDMCGSGAIRSFRWATPSWRDGVRCDRGGMQESDHSLIVRWVLFSAGCVGMVLSCGLPERANDLLGQENLHFVQDDALRRPPCRGFSRT
jgi:hypothetical protein